MWNWIASHDAYIVALQLGTWLVLGVATGPRLLALIREMRPPSRVALLALGVAATAISALWFPTFERFVPLGHEASYSECFLGESTPSSAHGWQPYVTYPLLRWGYWALGGIVGREGLADALAFNMAVRGLTVVLFGMLARALFRNDWSALLAALFLTVQPTHAFWGTSIYNVAIPCFFVVLCLLQSVVAWREGSRGLLAAAAVSGCLVVATRVEWGILAPSLALLLFGGLGETWGRSKEVFTGRFWAPALSLVVVIGSLIIAGAGALTTQGGYHDPMGYLATMARQAWILDFLEPFQSPWGLACLAVGVWAARADGALRPVLALLGFSVLSHCALATFNDFAYRHDLLPLMGLLLLAARGGGLVTSRTPRWLQVAMMALFLGATASGLSGISHNVDRYYATVEEFQAGDPGFAGANLSHDQLEDGSCYLITDNERLWSMGLAGSHFNLMEPGEAATHWQDHAGCIYWLFDFTDWRVDGLAVRARALKLRAWFDWEAIGHASFPDGNEAVVYRMSSPPWGLSEPPPGWGWGEEEVGGAEEGTQESSAGEVGGEEERSGEGSPSAGVESTP